MVALKNYHLFGGTHPETSSVQHALEYQGITVPQTGKPLSEATLLGISGGIVVGYFSFAYEGWDPHVALLTRNTFDPLENLFERLGIVQDVHQTTNPAKAEKNLVDALESGCAPLVWADIYSLPYNAPAPDDGLWIMVPLIVYGYDAAGHQVQIADRSNAPLTVSTEQFSMARGKVKKDKYKLVTLDLPGLDKLPKAVERGIRFTISLYNDMPPKGAKHNFGFAALQHWSELLVKNKDRSAWSKVFPRGKEFYAGLTSTFRSIEIFWTGKKASRPEYAMFLEEAALILDKPALKDAAPLFRRSGEAWRGLSDAVMPENVPLLAEARTLMYRRKSLFKEHGGAAIAEMQQIDARLKAIRQEVIDDFPLSPAETDALKETIRGHVLKIHDIELEAVNALEEAMS